MLLQNISDLCGKSMCQTFHQLVISGEHNCRGRGNPEHTRGDALCKAFVTFMFIDCSGCVPCTIVLGGTVDIALSLHLQPRLDNVLHINFQTFHQVTAYENSPLLHRLIPINYNNWYFHQLERDQVRKLVECVHQLRSSTLQNL